LPHSPNGVRQISNAEVSSKGASSWSGVIEDDRFTKLLKTDAFLETQPFGNVPAAFGLEKKAPHACGASWEAHSARAISRTGGGAAKTLPSGKPYAVVANPPSTGITAPQTKLLARDARYNAIPAISSGAPMRFIGASSTTWRAPCSSIASVIFDGK
jgi:hypothetical protein